MAAVKESKAESPENPDLEAVQQLIYSAGQLKFSMRNLASMQLQTALYSLTDSEPLARLNPLESNRVLENIINDISSSKVEQKDAGSKADQNPISIEDLELVSKKLQEEFEKRKSNFISSMSSRLKE